MHVWRKSRAYRVVVVGGLAVCVAVPVYLGLGPYEDDPGSKVPAYAAIATVGVYIFAVMIMQLAAMRPSKAGDPAELFEEPRQRPLGPADPPLGWKRLSAVMAVGQLDPTGEQLAADRITSGVARQTLLGLVLMVFVIGGMIAWISGAPPWVFAPAVLMVFVLVATVPGMMGMAQSSGDAYLKPLGLRILSMPRSETGVDALGRPRHQVKGPTVLAGERHGRQVRIDLRARTFETRIDGEFARFEIDSEDGQLRADQSSPAEVAGLIDSLTPDPRWRNVSAVCKGGAITVKRGKVKSAEAQSAIWLDDLWLAERLADCARAARD